MNGPVCPATPKNTPQVAQTIELSPSPRLENYRQAMELARQKALERLGENMLLSWYDRDRDFESPQHASECHQDSAIPGYQDYALYRGANLKVDIEQGRFVFYFLGID